MRSRSVSTAGHLALGSLLGAFTGALAGCIELLALAGETRADLLLAALDQVVFVYTLTGATGGFLIAAAISIINRSPVEPVVVASRTTGILAGVTLAGYLSLLATYRLGMPLLKLSNLAAYLGSLAAGWFVARIVSRALVPAFSFVQQNKKNFGSARMMVILVAATVLVYAATWVGIDIRGQKTIGARTSPGSSSSDSPNIVFLLIDTLRADHLPTYGYHRNTAPTLAALAKRGRIYENMYANSSDTRPSVATLFSSLYPSSHNTNTQREALPKKILTLAETLRAAGYTTLGISANPQVSPIFGYSQGFDAFRGTNDISPFRMTMLGSLGVELLGQRRFADLVGERAPIVRRADAITDGALDLVRRRTQSVPTFLYVHYIDPHAPYSPPSPYDTAFEADTNPSRGDAPSEADRAIALYDGEILFTDTEIARLFDGLEEEHVTDNAIIVVTSDHGEEFQEHGAYGHSRTLYEEVLHVPFLLVWPGHVEHGSTSSSMVSLIDVMPTLLGLINLQCPEHCQGVEFAGGDDEIDHTASDTLFAQLLIDRFSLEMIRSNDMKYIRHLRGPHKGRDELYDLRVDPAEQADLTDHEDPRVEPLRAAIDRMGDATRSVGRNIGVRRPGHIDDTTLEALRALGYIE
jgi:arylsulfatase A-like enzyme